MPKSFQPPSMTWANERAGMPLAAFWRRAAALAIDFLLVGGFFLAVVIYGGKLALRLGLVEPARDINLNFKFLGNWYSVIMLAACFALLTYFGKGQTPGKRLCRVRVVALMHHRLCFRHSVERALGYGASTLGFGFGFFQYFLRADRRTVHDRIAETTAVAVPAKPGKVRSKPASRRLPAERE